jgi:hypothetical protein
LPPSSSIISFFVSVLQDGGFVSVAVAFDIDRDRQRSDVAWGELNHTIKSGCVTAQAGRTNTRLIDLFE